LRDVIAEDQEVREAAIFGQFGLQLNVTDGRYVYMRSAKSTDNDPLFNYTLMPTHMRGAFPVEELAGKIELSEPFAFTKGCQTMKIPSSRGGTRAPIHAFGTALYDLKEDPKQERPLNDPAIEERMIGLLSEVMTSCEAPLEQFERLGI
ncbi:MAG: sulfatase, partial [Candidatus Latescibacteria bacterium]|nr:sulfatase [Candidatus Latescibacterota bacterium]